MREVHRAPDPVPGGAPSAADAEAALRANTYALLAALLARPPSRELVQRLCAIEGPAPEQAQSVGQAWQLLGLAARRCTVQSLADEYHAVFVGLTRGEVVPYGSWYQTGFLMDKPVARLRADLARLGFARQDQVHEPEDHAAALCEVMAMLVGGAGGEDEDTVAAFFSEHLEPWMGAFFRDLQQAQSALLYSAVGYLGEQFLELERRYLPTAPARQEGSRSTRNLIADS